MSGWFYPPPPPFIGGRQPYEPRKRKIFGMSVDAPPVVGPMPRAVLNSIGSTGNIPPPVPQQRRPSQIISRDAPPRYSVAPQVLTRGSWTRDPLLQYGIAPTPQIPEVDPPPLYSIATLAEIRALWNPPDPPPQQRLPAQLVSVDAPPTYSIAVQMAVRQNWLSPPWGAQGAPNTRISSVDPPPPASAVRTYWPDPVRPAQAYSHVAAFIPAAAAGSQPPPYSIAAQVAVQRAWTRDITLLAGISASPPIPEVDQPPPYS